MRTTDHPSSITIRNITAADAWPIRHTVMWPDHPFDFIKVARDETDGLHYGLFVDDTLTSIVSLYVDAPAAQFRKFATLKSQQGKGYGTQLLRYLLDEVAPSLDLEKIWCNARVNKADFYERFGLQKTEKTYVKGGIDFVVMEAVIRR